MSAIFNSVLLIDDSEIDVLVNRRLIELTRFASNVVVTQSGEEALNYLREECSKSSAPEWIFLDMYLPMMNGYDFIEEFKTLPDYITSKTRIVILSVFQKQERLQKAFENKFVAGRLEKPLTQDALRSLVENRFVTVSS